LREEACGDVVVGWTDTETGLYCRLDGPGADMSGIWRLEVGSIELSRFGLKADYALRVQTLKIEVARSEEARVSSRPQVL